MSDVKEIKHLKTKIHVFEDMLLRTKNPGQMEILRNELQKLRYRLQKMRFQKGMES